MPKHRAALVAVCLSVVLGSRVLADPQPIPAEQFSKLHGMIKPQDGEIRFWQIPWLLSISEARQQAAAEGKPILVWSGAGGAPIGLC